MRQAAATMVSIRSQRMSRTRKDTIHWLRVSEDQFGTTLPIPLPLIVASAKRRCRPSLVLGLPASSAPTRTGLQSHSPALGHRAHVLIAAPQPPPDGLLRRAGDGRCPLRQARNDLPHAQATDLRLAMISNANFRFRPNSRGHRDDGCRAPQVEPESPRRAADPYHRLVA